ncbi:MAG: oxidoreductase [Eubacteriales bacterium]
MTKKVIWVTGASSGIGKAIAKKMLEDGHIVYASARRAEKMADLKEAGAWVLPLDITDEAQAKKASEAIQKAHGGVDVLVNCAGFALNGSVEDVPIKQAKGEFDVNVFGSAGMTQLCLPYMREKGAGKIINISSIGGKIYSPLTGWYFASKYAIEALSKCLRVEVKRFGIDVVVIRPGLIASELSDITTETLIKTAKGGAYEATSDKVAKMMNGYKNMESDPSVIAKAVSRAVKAKRPRYVYAVGKFAKISLLAYAILPVRWMTNIMGRFS